MNNQLLAIEFRLARREAEVERLRVERDRSYRTINEIEEVLTDAGIAITSPLSDAVLELIVERERLREALAYYGKPEYLTAWEQGADEVWYCRHCRREIGVGHTPECEIAVLDFVGEDVA